VTVDAEQYIEQYGANLTEAEKRYIRAFGAPQIAEGPARRAYTPGLRIADAPTADPRRRVRADEEALEEADELLLTQQHALEEEEYFDAASHGAA
jgi:hypothetical protein